MKKLSLDLSLIRELYKKHTAKEIASILKVSIGKITNIIRSNNIVYIRDLKGHAIEPLFIKNLIDKGLSVKEIATTLSASYDTINNWVRQQNLELKEVCAKDLKNQFLKNNSCITHTAEDMGLSVFKTKALLLKYKIIQNTFKVSKTELETHINNGLSRQAIAKIYKVGTPEIALKIEELKIITRKKGASVSKEELHKLYVEEKKSLEEMSQILGVSDTTIWRHIKVYNLKRSFNPDPEEIRSTFQNETLKTDDIKRNIMKKYNVSLEELEIFLEKHNIKKVLRKKRFTIDIKDSCVQLYMDGKTVQQITKILGLSTTYTVQILQMANVYSPRRYTYAFKPIVQKNYLEFLYCKQFSDIKSMYAVIDIATLLKTSVYHVKKCLQYYQIKRI